MERICATLGDVTHLLGISLAKIGKLVGLNLRSDSQVVFGRRIRIKPCSSINRILNVRL